MIANKKYPVLTGDNLKIPIKMQLSYKQKNFSRFFTIVLTSRLKFKRFEKKDDPRNFCISDITNSENVVRRIPKKSSFRVPFEKRHARRAQALLKCASDDLNQIHWSLPNKLSWKKSLLLACQFLGELLNTLAANEKYPVLNRHNLTKSIQMQLSWKD